MSLEYIFFLSNPVSPRFMCLLQSNSDRSLKLDSNRWWMAKDWESSATDGGTAEAPLCIPSTQGWAKLESPRPSLELIPLLHRAPDKCSIQMFLMFQEKRPVGSHLAFTKK